MKLYTRISSMVLALMFVLTCTVAPAFAAENLDNGFNAVTQYIEELYIPESYKFADTFREKRASNETIDLGSNGYSTVTLSSFAPKNIKNSDNYTTNSQKIVVRLGTTSASPIMVRITLYKLSSGDDIGEETVTVRLSTSLSTTTVTTFTGLTSAYTYYLTFENVGQTSGNIFGSVAAK